jgi:hypothetical protein
MRWKFEYFMTFLLFQVWNQMKIDIWGLHLTFHLFLLHNSVDLSNKSPFQLTHSETFRSIHIQSIINAVIYHRYNPPAKVLNLPSLLWSVIENPFNRKRMSNGRQEHVQQGKVSWTQFVIECENRLDLGQIDTKVSARKQGEK